MNNFILLTNSWLSIILFFIKNNNLDFCCWKYEDSFFTCDWVDQRYIELPKSLERIRNTWTKITLKIFCPKNLKFWFFWIFKGPSIPFNHFKELFKWEKSNWKRKTFLILIITFSILLGFKYIYSACVFRKWMKENNIKDLHFFSHFDTFSYALIRHTWRRNVYIYDDGLSRFNKDYIDWLLHWKVKRKINKIYLFKTSIDKKDYLKEYYSKKYEEINIKDELNKIRWILEKFHKGIKLKKNSRILVTQPLVYDGILTFEELFDIYKKIVKKNNINCMKVHPRDNIDWAKHFPKIKLLKDFPLELMFFEIDKITNVSTIFSSIVPEFKTNWTSITFLGTKFNKKLLENFGEFNEIIL